MNLRRQGSEQTDSDPLLQLVWFGIYGITLCLLAAQWRGFTRIPRNLDKVILLLTGVAITSYLWSAAPGLTIRRGIALLGTTVFGVYFATRYNPKEQLRLLAWTFGISAVLSLIFGLVLPRYGLDPATPGAWQGVYQHKNILGRFMTLGALVFLLLGFSSNKYRWLAWSMFGLSVALVLLSKSKTALVVLLTLLILLPFYRALRWRSTVSVPLFIISILLFGSLAVWFTTEAETILGALGKDVTLTGRTKLWELVIAAGQQRPWLGYGYSAFWLGWEALYIREVLNWLTPHAHNGYLDLWLDLGILGVSIFAISFLKTLAKAITWVRHTQTLENLWPMVFLTFTLLFNLAQSSILSRNDLLWVLYVAINISKPLQFYRSAKLTVGTIPNKGELVKDV